MNDVCFAIIGSGRLARHLQHYLHGLDLPYVTWSRRDDPDFFELSARVRDASHILLAVSDSAIETVAQKLPLGPQRVHFAGAVTVAGVAAAHPLMTFTETLKPLAWYERIPFVIDPGRSLSQLLPGLPNPSFELAPEQRKLYHALCSLAGHSSFVMWQAVRDIWEQDLGLPAQALSPYLHQVVDNALTEGRQALTGPLARGDGSTLQQHLAALPAPLQKAYKNYLSMAATRGFTIPIEVENEHS